jgi:uncharacterized damage-inducible protein DinB
MTKRNELQRLLIENAAFTPPPRIVDSVPPAARTNRPPGMPHSIAEELWHIVFWQDHFLRWARQEQLDYPAHADSGWQSLETVDDEEWDALTRRFLLGLDQAVVLASEPGLDSRYSSLVEPNTSGPITMSELLTNIAVHNAYHLGRIVQLRQVLGCWPPPGGGDTW